MLLVLTMQTRLSGKYFVKVRRGKFEDFPNTIRGMDCRMVRLEVYGTPTLKEAQHITELEKHIHLTLRWEPNPVYQVIYH